MAQQPAEAEDVSSMPNAGGTETSVNPISVATEPHSRPDVEESSSHAPSAASDGSNERLLPGDDGAVIEATHFDAGRVFDCGDKTSEADHGRAQMLAATGFSFNFIMMITTAIVGISTNSSIMFVMSSQHLLDAIGDVLVMWRFWCDPNDPNNTQWDRQGSAMISFCALISGMYVIAFTAQRLVHSTEPQFDWFALVCACVIFVASSSLATSKYVVARRLDSRSLHLDAITSFFVAMLAGVYVACAVVHKEDNTTWWVEHALALGLTSALFMYAAFNLYRTSYKGAAWYERSFWVLEERRCSMDGQRSARHSARHSRESP